ncbi:putative rapid ALkalinization Factor [Helianthus annuus]|uniref:Rapid ALkalinization Factor n=2 Tax=Helianthus annuus TaxID=4232 RepID=A0A9K3E0L3_HELAN|nr:putative rapid ALkalinization Factor [Helianthus annuus]
MHILLNNTTVSDNISNLFLILKLTFIVHKSQHYFHQQTNTNFFQKMATHGSRNTILINFLTCVILLLSIIFMMMNHCEGSLSSSRKYADECNGTMAECPMLVEEDEEFLMDTEEHRRILAETNTISYDSLQSANAACGGNCEGLYNVKKVRGCLRIYGCRD